MATMKTYLVMYMPSRSITPIPIDEDAIIDAFFNLPDAKNHVLFDAFFNLPDAKNHVLGFADFLIWYDGVIRHRFGKVAVTESGYPILLWNNQSWLMIEALDVFDAVKKAETILHERIKH